MAEKENSTLSPRDKISEVQQILKRLHALGAVLANQDWDCAVIGEDTQYLGFLIEDLTDEASEILKRPGEAPQAAPEGGAE